MKITRSDGDRLVIVHFPWIFAGFMLLIALSLLAQPGIFWWQDRPLTRNAWIEGGIGLVLLLLVLALTRCSVFTFERGNRRLVWSRTGLLGRTGGTLPFHQITGARVETSSGAENGVCYRVALTLSDGTLPLTNSYSGTAEKISHTVCNAINGTLGTTPQVSGLDDEEESDVRTMIENGQMIAAIARVRQVRGCTLIEAKNYVESLRTGPKR